MLSSFMPRRRQSKSTMRSPSVSPYRSSRAAPASASPYPNLASLGCATHRARLVFDISKRQAVLACDMNGLQQVRILFRQVLPGMLARRDHSSGASPEVCNAAMPSKALNRLQKRAGQQPHVRSFHKPHLLPVAEQIGAEGRDFWCASQPVPATAERGSTVCGIQDPNLDQSELTTQHTCFPQSPCNWVLSERLGLMQLSRKQCLANFGAVFLRGTLCSCERLASNRLQQYKCRRAFSSFKWTFPSVKKPNC